MVDSKYLMLNTEFFNIKCEIKHYHYNFNYKIWTLVFNDDNVIFVYDKNINNLIIIKNDTGIVGYVVNKTLIKYDDIKIVGYVFNKKLMKYVDEDET